LLRPMVVLEPVRVPDLSGKRILVSAGAQDPIVPADDPARLAGSFRSAGATVSLHTQQAGHGLVPGDLAVATAYLAQT
jgi:phospholipase/carboxylesterase